MRAHGFITAVALAALAAAIPAAPTNAQPEAIPVAEIAARVDLDPRMWCRPVVNAAINPDPLICWLALATAAPDSYPPKLTGMNMGDYPPFSDIDPKQLNANLTRYEQGLEAERLEAERLEAERQAAANRPAPRPNTRRTIPEPDLDHARRLTEAPETPAHEDSHVDNSPHDCVMNCTPGLTLEIPPMPAECNGAGIYDSAWGGWKCLGMTP